MSYSPKDELNSMLHARKQASILSSGLKATGSLAEGVGKAVWSGAKRVAGAGPAPNVLGKSLSKNVGAAGIVGTGALAASQTPIAAKKLARKTNETMAPLKANRARQKKVFL